MPIFRILKESCLLPFLRWPAFLAVCLTSILILQVLRSLTGETGLPVNVLLLSSFGNEGLGRIQFSAAVAYSLVYGLALLTLFNLFTRYGVLIDDRAWKQSWRKWLGQLSWNTFNFLWIFALIGFVWAGLGFLIGWLEELLFSQWIDALLLDGTEGNPGGVIQAIWLLSILPMSLMVYSVYARFSFYVVEGALGKRYADKGQPRRELARWSGRFTILLVSVTMVEMALYGIVALVVFVDAHVQTTLIGETVIKFYGMAVFGAAHGIVFRWRTQSAGSQMQGAMSADVVDEDVTTSSNLS